MTKRAEKLAARLAADEAYYITEENSVRYYSGFAGEGRLLVTAEACILFTDSRYTEAAERIEGLSVFDIAKGTENGVPSAVNKLYLSEADISLAAYKNLQKLLPQVEFLPDRGQIAQGRMQKSPEELKLIAAASEISEHAYLQVLNFVKPGVSEKALAFEYEWLCRKAGAQGLSFDVIAASGPNSSMPHATVTDRCLENGDFITFDLGCVVEGYCSDMTRTVALGSCSDEMREVYAVVLQAQLAGLAQVRSGTACRAADAAARSIIAEAGYGEYFGHSLGHGVGLAVHEAPNLSPKSDFTLEENMVVTVEPGIYLPGKFGVRIEDLVVAQAEKCEILTKNSKELLII